MLTQPQTPQLFNPDEQKKLAAMAQKYQLLEIKFAASKRDVKVFKADGTIDEYMNVDLSRANDGFLTLFMNSKNEVVRYPSEEVLKVEETLRPE